MNASKLIVCLVAPFCLAGTALAQDAAPAAAERALSRAEVLADLQVWHESGMAALHGGDEPAIFHPNYQATVQRYAALRESPAFALLVQRIESARSGAISLANVH
jgi:hypothetical protein